MTREEMRKDIRNLNEAIDRCYEGMKKMVKVVEDFYYADLEGVAILMEALGYKYQIGRKFYKDVSKLSKGWNNAWDYIEAKPYRNGFVVRIETIVER